MKTNCLTIEDLRELTGQYIDWNSEYHIQEWKDGPSPLLLIDVWEISKTDTWAVFYKCSRENCLKCKNPYSISSQFHHKLVLKNGMDICGYPEEVKISKKKSEIQLIEQPVFQFYSF